MDPSFCCGHYQGIDAGKGSLKDGAVSGAALGCREHVRRCAEQTRSTVCGQLLIGSRRATPEEHLHLLQRDFSVLIGIDSP